jgi:uncharacterized protein
MLRSRVAPCPDAESEHAHSGLPKMLKAISRGLCLLATLGLAVACGPDPGGPQAASDPARPALWRIADADTAIYLFGTIHMLPPDAAWRSSEVDAALAGARTVYFETDVEGDVRERTELVQRLGLLVPGKRLSDSLAPAEASALRAAAARLGYPLAVLETQRPWYAAVTLADAAIRAAGYSSDTGVETLLRQTAEAAGKELRFLETMEQQLSTLADLPEAVQVSYLAYSVSDIETVKPQLASMVAAWRAGDTATLTEDLIDKDMARLPALRAALLAQRNANWAAELKTLLTTETGQFFVAVGAAHMLGDDSVLMELGRRGISSERIQ